MTADPHAVDALRRALEAHQHRDRVDDDERRMIDEALAAMRAEGRDPRVPPEATAYDPARSYDTMRAQGRRRSAREAKFARARAKG